MTSFLIFLRGTMSSSVSPRAMGAKIVARACIGTISVFFFDLLKVGENCCIGIAWIPHRERLFPRGEHKVGRSVVVGSRTGMRANTVIQEYAMLDYRFCPRGSPFQPQHAGKDLKRRRCFQRHLDRRLSSPSPLAGCLRTDLRVSNCWM